MTRFVSLVWPMLCAFLSNGQNFITGVVQDTLHQPMPFCTLGLLKQPGDSLCYGMMADARGSYTFENGTPGNYKIKVVTMSYNFGKFKTKQRQLSSNEEESSRLGQ